MSSVKRPAIPVEESANGYEHDYPDPLATIDKDQYDLVVIGAGPAGLMLSSSMARLGQYSILIVDERDVPTTAGRADGIQARTIEVLKNMSPLGEQMLSRASASYERTFWDPKPDMNGIERSRRAISFPKDMEIGNGATLGLQQGLIEQAFLRDMESRGQRVTRPWRFKSLSVSDSGEYPVLVEVSKVVPDGQPEEVRKVKAKYLTGCDGGRSAVRLFLEQNHIVEMKGDWVDTLWGAIDAVVKSDFPDLRKIAAIHSAKYGAMYIFPRENNADGKPVVRLYTQVDKMTGAKSTDKPWEAKERITAEDIMATDKKIISPYKLEFEKVEWWTAYPIGQRLVSRYTSLNNRVFLAGDACHTHSPKAGQGMNTALMDCHNLSFKLHYVLSGLGKESLLEDYHSERWKVGKQLIDFDMEYAALFSGQVPKNAPEVAHMNPEQLKVHFANVQRQNAAFTTGAGVHYPEGPTVIPNASLEVRLGLKPLEGLKLQAGWRLFPAKVTRCVNTQPVELIQEIQFDSPGSFRIYVLTGDLAQNKSKLEQLSKYLRSPQAFTQRFHGPVSKGRKLPQVLNTGLLGYEELNPYFAILTVVKKGAFEFDLEDWVDLKGINAALYADDEEPRGEWNAEQQAHIGGTHMKYGLVDGGIVVVRPDGYVGVVVPLSEQGWNSLERYFNGFMRTAKL